MTRVAILGTAGIPAAYGGFETLAHNLADYNETLDSPFALEVYCSGASSTTAEQLRWRHTELRYLPISANGVSSIAYDSISLILAVLRSMDVVLLLGVSGAIALPFVRLVSRCKIVTNIDGMEWRRAKWSRMARWWLRFSEAIAVRYSHQVIADNQVIEEYLAGTYGKACEMIAYGGDHALKHSREDQPRVPLPDRYALALCRIEPENNVAMLLDAFASNSPLTLVFVGNWKNSGFGRELQERYRGHDRLILLDPIYDQNSLWSIRAGCELYVHGHSAGGTNPSLVEMMHFGVPVLAFDCAFNRFSTDGEAAYFGNAAQLGELVRTMSEERRRGIGAKMRAIARERYTWAAIGKRYFSLFSALGRDATAPAP
jgi:glycosyltransferase involved in cell wall biosynthesis